MIWQPSFLSLQVTLSASLVIFVLGLTLGTVLAKCRFPGQLVLSTVLNLPLVLPPSVVGYGLLLALGRGSPIREWLGIDLLFTWQAAAIASTVVALPLMVESTRAARSRMLIRNWKRRPGRWDRRRGKFSCALRFPWPIGGFWRVLPSVSREVWGSLGRH